MQWMPLPPLAALFTHPGHWQRLPPPCAMQKGLCTDGALLLQPSFAQRSPPPWLAQKGESPQRAAFWQPSAAQRRPPPCAAQNWRSSAAPGRAMRLHSPSSSTWRQRLPPPWRPHSSAPPEAAERGQSATPHRRPPPCDLQNGAPPARRALLQPGCMHLIRLACPVQPPFCRASSLCCCTVSPGLFVGGTLQHGCMPLA